MMIAASAGHMQIVKLLLGHGAQVNAVNIKGQCPLHYAASKDWIEVWPQLMNSGHNFARNLIASGRVCALRNTEANNFR